MRKLYRTLTVATLCLGLGAGSSLPVMSDNLTDAVASTERPEADLARDALRKPEEVMRFMGVTPGMKILDMLSGAGYYTELLSRAVGDEGSVTAHNNQAYLNFAKDALATRFSEGRLGNVERVTAEVNDLDLADGTYDGVWLGLTYHDFYFEQEGWPKIDVPRLLAELKAGLKTGGFVAITDHVALKGSGHAAGGTLHRIDPEIVVAEMTAAGFRLDKTSDVLANPDDPHDVPMWDPKVNGKTDRFVMRFIKP